jgi:hypothetical protein
MSTQLILFPQNYRGYSSTLVGGGLQWLVDGINFIYMDGSDAITISGGVPVTTHATDVLVAQPPTIVNAWYRSRDQVGMDYPAQFSTDLVMYARAGATRSFSTVYQRMDNLVVGQSYIAWVYSNFSSGSTSIIYVRVSNGTTGVVMHMAGVSASAVGTGNIGVNFTAETTQDVVMVIFSNSYAAPHLDDSIIVTEISVTSNIISPSGVYTDLQDGQVICDLYQEEDIPLTLSIDNFKNVAEKVQSYSKDFNLPATKRNNQIFNNMFEITRADDGLIFNPYVQTKCVLKQDGFILFEGFLRMIDVKDKEGEISYNVNLYSEVIALSDILKDRTFADLSLSELTSDYNITNIKASWDGDLVLENALTDPNEFAGPVGATTTDVLKYPFIDWNHQFFLDANFNPEMPNLNSAFRPCINVKYLISKIFAEAGFNWTSDFFDSTDFGKLYMDFNWGNDENPTDIKSSGFGQVRKFDTFADNFATTSWTAILLSSDHFSDSQGYALASGVFTVPAGQSNTTYVINYSADFLFLNYTNKASASFRWIKNLGITGETVINLDDNFGAGHQVEGSAVAYAQVGASGGIFSLVLVHGGYYDSAPTIVFVPPGSGSSAAATANGSFPGTVTSLTLTNSGGNYSPYSPPFMKFEGVNRNQPVYTSSGSLSVTLEAGDTLQFQMTSDIADAVLQDHRRSPYDIFMYNFTTATIWLNSNVDNMADATLLNALRGEVGQWDFLKGIMTMFNLVTMVDETNKNNILIEPYSDVFIKNTNSGTTGDLTLASRSIEHDWTDKVDVSQMELRPLTDLNKDTVFKFVEDDEDYCFNAYKLSTSGGLYGAKYFDASGFTILVGEKEIIAEPFAATVMKPLQDFFPDFIVPSIYAVDESGASEGFDNSPRILYDNGIQTLTSCTYTIPDQNGVTGITDEDEFLQFSHLSSIPIDPNTTVDFNFKSDQLIQPLDAQGMPTDNLYSMYWQPYFNELYNADTRTMTLKVNLSPSDIATFKFYDTVMIKNRSFRVNKIEYKPNSLAKVEFILIP